MSGRRTLHFFVILFFLSTISFLRYLKLLKLLKTNLSQWPHSRDAIASFSFSFLLFTFAQLHLFLYSAHTFWPPSFSLSMLDNVSFSLPASNFFFKLYSRVSYIITINLLLFFLLSFLVSSFA